DHPGHGIRRRFFPADLKNSVARLEHLDFRHRRNGAQLLILRGFHHCGFARSWIKGRGWDLLGFRWLSDDSPDDFYGNRLASTGIDDDLRSIVTDRRGLKFNLEGPHFPRLENGSIRVRHEQDILRRRCLQPRGASALVLDSEESLVALVGFDVPEIESFARFDPQD